MTAAQKQARAQWREAMRQRHIAAKGERDRTRKALEQAVVRVLKADIAARHA